VTEDELTEDLKVLLEKGLISVEYDEELNATVGLTDKGKLYVQTHKDIT
jgi:predicted transcriptional regulator